MARLNVNPTRMELNDISKRLKTASRGHKLLKDKQDELMRQFIKLSKETMEKRTDVSIKLAQAMRSFSIAKASLPEPFIEELFAGMFPKVHISTSTDSIMSVQIPKFTIEDEKKHYSNQEYGYLNSSADMDDVMQQMLEIQEDLIEMAQLEKSLELMAFELDRTRRRVNALEHMTIPQLEETLYYIRMKLEENERSNIVRMIKIKGNS